MDDFFALLVLACLIALAVGLIKPGTVIRWGAEEKKTRKQVFLYYGIGLLVCFVLFGITVDSEEVAPNEPASKTSTSETGSETEEPVLSDEEMAAKVDALIVDIGDVSTMTTDDLHKVIYARTEYNDLNDAQKALVTKLDTLAAAEKKSAEIREKARQEEEAEKERIAHDEWVSSQFSAWDGSHRDLVKLVKENMNDADSFEHVETKYLVLDSQEKIDKLGSGEIGDLYVYMKFRGANAFGGIILSEVEALASYKNNTITLLSNF